MQWTTRLGFLPPCCCFIHPMISINMVTKFSSSSRLGESSWVPSLWKQGIGGYATSSSFSSWNPPHVHDTPPGTSARVVGVRPWMKNTNRDQQAQRTLHKIQGVVEKIFYRQRETGFSVADVRVVAASTDIPENVIQVVGALGDVQQGDEVQGSGFITNHPKYGKQFKLVGKKSGKGRRRSASSLPERHYIVVEKVVFSAPDDSGFAVGQARFLDNNDEMQLPSPSQDGSSLQNETEKITIVGKLGKIEEGLHLAVEGVWVNHSKYGKQFQVQVAQTEPFSHEDY
jgi:hypothetical protein